MLLMIRQALIKYYWQLVSWIGNCFLLLLSAILRIKCQKQPVGMQLFLRASGKDPFFKMQNFRNLIRNSVHIYVFNCYSANNNEIWNTRKLRGKYKTFKLHDYKNEKKTSFCYESLWSNFASCGAQVIQLLKRQNSANVYIQYQLG